MISCFGKIKTTNLSYLKKDLSKMTRLDTIFKTLKLQLQHLTHSKDVLIDRPELYRVIGLTVQ